MQCATIHSGTSGPTKFSWSSDSEFNAFQSRGSQSVVPIIATLASPKSLLEIEILRPHPKSTNEKLGVGPKICILTSRADDSDAH